LNYQNSIQYAKKLDREDPLRSFRKKFLVPQINGKHTMYFIGNSLGLQPKSTKKFIEEELTDWARLGGEGHTHARRPWLYYHKLSKKALAEITGAKPSEVVAMNQLTVNLHLMLVSFYRPTPKRFKIITEAGAFPSDQYAFESHIKFHDFNPEEALIELKPREGEHILRTDDILNSIRENASSVALVIFGGVQYYTGQFFDLAKITAAGHEAGAVVGFDLAHAIGNTPLRLHKDEVDFAVWCSYKYLNAGPGGLAGAFVHEKHGSNFSLPRFAGWWGHDEKERFEMKKEFKPMQGVDGWQLSNVPVFQGAALLSSLMIFQEAGMNAIRKKSILLTGFLQFLFDQIDPDQQFFQIITPRNKNERGCQLSLFIKSDAKAIFKKLEKNGIVADYRSPDVIRIAPVPLYNTFEEVYHFATIFSKLFK